MNNVVVHDDFLDDVEDDEFCDLYEDDDPCYECGGYGDDYFINDDGELECSCSSCSFNRANRNRDE